MRKMATSPSHICAGIRLFLLAATFLMLLPGTISAQFVELCAVPASAGDRASVAILRFERSGLENELNGLRRIGEIYGDECVNLEVGSGAYNQCLTNFRTWDAERADLNRRVGLFCARIAALAPPRPVETDLDQVEGGTDQALRSANTRTSYLLDALERFPNDWRGSIVYLEDIARGGDSNPDVRAALNYLKGMHRGALAAEDMSNRYYKYGVRRWLENDYAAAARAFAQASRDNPDDLRVFRSFAEAVGAQNATPACTASGDCVSGDLPRWASFFGPEHQEVMASLREIADGGDSSPELSTILNLLEGMAVYASAVPDRAASLSDAVHQHTLQAINASRRGDYTGAARGYARAYAESDDDRAILFFRYYWEGYGAADESVRSAAATTLQFEEFYRDMLDPPELDLRRLESPAVRAVRAPGDEGSDPAEEWATQALAALNAALYELKDTNPFFSRLLPGEIAGISE